jgi:proline iminopeptidase
MNSVPLFRGTAAIRKCCPLRKSVPTICLLLAALALSFYPSRASAHVEHGTTFHAPGATIYYEVFGSGSATPLFVANGGPGFDHQYLHVSDVWDTLGQNRQIVMWDQRGTGQSGPLQAGQSCTLADQIDDLEALRAHLGYEKIDLLGHSWGGFLAMAYAARHPEHIERLIILDSAAPRWRDTLFLFHDVFPDVTAREDSYEFTVNLKEKDSDAAADDQTRLYLSMLCYAPEHRDELLAKMANDKEYRNVNHLVNEDVGRFDLNPEIVKFHFPVLVGTGRFDMNVAPVIAYKIHQAISGSQFAVFDKSGHLPFFEQPEQFVSVVNKFLSGGSTTP